jgi:DNA invertase Pin-like site-specific DNA recombinase
MPDDYTSDEYLSKQIKVVLIYLRKSRGEEDNDLDKHRYVLADMCIKYGWKYIVLSEIGTSDSIDLRPKMSAAINDIEEGMYDAVGVMDIDRLSRGDDEDSGRIRRILRSSDTLIATPTKIYDLNNEEDDQQVDFKVFMGRQEYKAIRKRFMRGKKTAARLGKWVNGSPPYPYEYERWGQKYLKQGCVVNDDKLAIFNMMKANALAGVSTNEISYELNRRGISSPTGVGWGASTVKRILANPVTLGHIVSNKSEGEPSPKKRKPGAKPYKRHRSSDWIIVENCHEAVITQEEFDKINYLMQERATHPCRAREQAYDFTGLVKCGRCGYAMSFVHGRVSRELTYIKCCKHASPTGEKCPNRGGSVQLLQKHVFAAIAAYKDELNEVMENQETGNIELDRQQLQERRKHLGKLRAALEKAKDTYDMGDYTRDEWLQRRERWQKEIDVTASEASFIERTIAKKASVTNQDRIAALSYVLNNINTLSGSAEKNTLLKSVINNIVWTRTEEKDDPEIDIYYH